MTSKELSVLASLECGYYSASVPSDRTTQALQYLTYSGLARCVNNSGYEITQRGRVFIDHVCALRLPIQSTEWFMPKEGT